MIDTLEWRQALRYLKVVCLTLLFIFHTGNKQKGEKGGDDRKLLDNVWGEVPEKQTTAIMGPSGAGKVKYCS